MKCPEESLPHFFGKQDFIHVDIETLVWLREQDPASRDLLIRESSKDRILPLDGAPKGQMIVRTVDECPIINPFGDRNSGANQLALIDPEDAHISLHHVPPLIMVQPPGSWPLPGIQCPSGNRDISRLSGYP
jgi:hypothetical protein